MTEITVGRFLVTVELAETQTIGTKYDVVLSKDGKVVKSSTGCIGEQSAEYWKEYWIKFAKRLEILYHALDMANHNLMCYSKNLLMDSPKDGYEEKWAEMDQKQRVIAQWLDELEA